MTDEYYMQCALDEAMDAFEEDEVPVGAVVVSNGRIIGRGHNRTRMLNDVTAHAEMQAITAAANCLGAKYLTDCTLYVTLEPCVMCAGAIAWAQVSRLVYAAKKKKKGYSLIKQTILHPKTEVVQGVKEEEASALLKDFFGSKRKS